MKIAQVTIENFRHIEKLDLDFTDSLGRVRDVSLIIGPNTSGKTTVLDAIGVGLGIATEFYYERPGFELTPPAIVRRGALQAKVTYQIRFTPEEIEATRELYCLAEEDQEIPWEEEVALSWEYPDRKGDYSLGFVRCYP